LKDYRRMRGRRHLVVMLLLASCSSQQRQSEEPSGQLIDAQLRDARRDGIAAAEATVRRDLQMRGTLGYVRPGVPLRTPAETLKVWIPAFTDEHGARHEGHWVHVTTTPEDWLDADDEATPPLPRAGVPRRVLRPTKGAR
jgi:hypothetical protein